MSNKPPLAITIDVEDWPQSTWNKSLPITQRGNDNAARLLDRLSRLGARTTLFVLGKFANAFPEIVRRMAREGHEVACHGYGHEEIFKQTKKEFRDDIRRSKSLLEDLTGAPVHGYRAPDFSILRENLWALDVLVEEGFLYDSSIFPIKSVRYGIEDWPRHPVTAVLPSCGTIIELPLATVSILGLRLPVAGGGYHRLLPFRLIDSAIRRVLADGLPFVAYCHPYEFDPAEFAMIDLPIPMKTRLHQGLGRRNFADKFEKIIRRYGSVPAGEVACGTSWPRYPVTSDAGRLCTARARS